MQRRYQDHAALKAKVEAKLAKLRSHLDTVDQDLELEDNSLTCYWLEQLEFFEDAMKEVEHYASRMTARVIT